MSISEKTEEYLTKWAEQLKVPIEELRDKFLNKLAAATVSLAAQDLSAERIEVHARKQLANEMRPGRSRAETYEGVILGYGRVDDWNGFFIRNAKSQFDKNSMEAIAQGVCDQSGIPLVTQEVKDKKGEFFRPNVGEPIPHQWERHLLAVGRPVLKKDEDDNQVRMFWIKLTGEPALFGPNFPAPQVGMVARWRCNVQEVNKEWNWVRANGATVTKFEPTKLETGSGTREGIVDSKICVALLEQVRDGFKVSDAGGIEAWLEDHSKKTGTKPGHFCVVEGEILNMYQAAMRLGDADQMDLESISSILCNLDSKLIDQMFYGEDSTVVAALEPFWRKVRRDGKVVMGDDGKPTMEIIASCIAVFPIIAAPKVAPVIPDEAAKTEEPAREEEAITL